jgi:HEAT repeat protein
MIESDTDQKHLSSLLDVLQNPASSNDILCDAVYQLIELGDQEAIEPLLLRLTNQSDPPWVRRELITALGHIALVSGTDTLDVRNLLLEIVNSTEKEEVRSVAALALGSLGETRVVESLLEILESEDDEMTYACVAALGNLGDPRAIDPLTRLLPVDKLLIPQTAAQGLEKFGAAAAKALPALEDLARRGNEAEKRFALKAITAIEEDSHGQ